MQTREMKREYEVAVLDPAGNVTAIVLSDVLAAERARIAAQLLRLPELRIEQAAFLTAPRCGGEIRLEMMGGEFCGNALRCAGFYHALRTGAQGKTCVLAEISGAEGVQPVMADTAAGEASTVMPLPRPRASITAAFFASSRSLSSVSLGPLSVMAARIINFFL